jgi:hypothetical protein
MSGVTGGKNGLGPIGVLELREDVADVIRAFGH